MDNEEYCDEIVAELIRFLEGSSKEKAYKAPEELESRIFFLFDENQRITACGDGLGFYYAVLTNNKLLEITFDMGNKLLSEFRFNLYDDADKFIVEITKPHPQGFIFIQLINANGNAITNSNLSFDVNENDNGKHITDLIEPISIEQIKERGIEAVTK